MPSPRLDAFEPSQPQPQKVDVVIVGGGIIGAATAWELSERGVSVALCEKGLVAGEQSSRNWGWVRLSRRDPREIDLMVLSTKIWDGMAQRIGVDVGYRRCGIVAPYQTASARRDNEAWLDHVRGTRHQMGSLDAAAIRKMLPEMHLDQQGGFYAPTDGRAEPQLAAPALARAAQRNGAAILTHCAVRRIEVAGGRVTGVITEDGRIQASTVVVAGGAWSRLLLRGIGVALPQLKVLNSVCRTEPLVGGPDVTVRGPQFSMRKRMDGSYTVALLGTNIYDLTPDSFRFLPQFLPILRREWSSLRPRVGRQFLKEWRDLQPFGASGVSPFERTRILDPEPSVAVTDMAMTLLSKAFPVFRDVKVAQRWASYIDFTPDAVPVISPIDAVSGLVISTGFSGHGFGLGPGAGRLTADIVTGATPCVDPHAFRFSRFSDGSDIVPLTGV